jgi:hypothetical protein
MQGVAPVVEIREMDAQLTPPHAAAALLDVAWSLLARLGRVQAQPGQAAAPKR